VRVETDYVDGQSFDLDLFIRRVPDPRSVYMDRMLSSTTRATPTLRLYSRTYRATATKRSSARTTTPLQ